jgi:lipopolysaccharide transport system ATP-binding protein
MSDVVISVRKLSKQYRIGTKDKQADTFLSAVRNILEAPLRNYRQIRNLTRSTENFETLFWALRDINFEVRQGEVLGIIGHNGAGKSTLLKILSRITDPTEGEIKIRGRVSALLEVGTGFHPELTGRENVYLNGTILGMSKNEIERKFDEIVGFSGIQKYIDTPVKFYSSGMKVRLAFAIAAHLEPELLIIDEVLAVGDAEFQKKCIGRMESVAKQGRTVLFVSHDLLAVQNLCSRALLLKKGNIIADGDPGEVIHKYRQSAVIDKHDGIFLLDDMMKKVKSDIFRTKSLKVKNRNGIGNKITLGDPFGFEISYEKNIDILLVTEVTIVLKNRSFVPVVTFATLFQKASLNLVESQGKFDCTVRNLLLTPGEYFIHVWISVNNKVAEIIENAGVIEIIESDIFETGVMPNQKNHGFLVHKEFQYR